jgi:hypothetical protein
MNLWARTTIRQLTVLAVALLFSSCEDESSILGFKNPNPRFKVNYVDIPLESSVFLMDSLRTSNNFSSQTETTRLLVGKYNDPDFGEIRSTAISQYFTSTGTKLKTSAVFDSVSVQLRFDFYTYGSKAPTPQTISVHEIEKELKIDSVAYYFNRSNTPYNPTALGTKTFTVDPTKFEDYVEDRLDTTITVSIPLEHAFGQRIFDSAIKYRDATTVADSAFVKYSEFVKEFKGVAIVADDADKVVSFNPKATASRITLHYHDADADSLQLNLSFSGVVNYNKIEADRSSTALSGLNQLSQPITPDNGLRYVQSGTGVLTRLDFSRFHEFVDADSNLAMIVNSAELHLGAALPSPYDPIQAISLRAVKGDGYLKKIADPSIDKAQHLSDSLSVTLYAGQLGITGNMLTPMSFDGQNIFVISRTGDNTYYNGFLTLFAQQLFKKDANKQRFRYFALYPESPPIARSVNRLIFNEQNIRLRVYYTRPQSPPQ